MTTEDRPHSRVWVVIMVASLLFLVWTLLVLLLSRGNTVLEDALALAGSPLTAEDIDEAALGFLRMAMLKPLWEEVWIGILGIYCALGLKRNRKHAWTLSLFWGIMLLANGAIQGGYEVIILKWSNACLQTYLFLVLGTIALASLLITRREFARYQTRRG